MDRKTVDEFIQSIRNQYPPFTKINNNFDELRKTKFNKNECLFVWDVRLGEILFVKGIENLLGYKDDEITLSGFANLFHENDKEYILRIGQSAIEYALKYPESNSMHRLSISHRIKTINGDFIKILAQSKPYEFDNKGYITKFLVIFSDISFVDSTDLVQYKFTAKGLDAESFHNHIYDHNKSLFSSREIDIIKELKNGHSSSKIALMLEISVHTVASHRKKIMKKSDCHSVKEVILFCKKNGILID